MSNYKNTLNLPQTAFPMKANLAEREPGILKKWEEMQIYSQLRAAGKNKKRFILLDGPPYANGHLHLGHAVNKILKDIVVKSKTLSGFDAPFVPGWDCHGLPIELNVEKKYGKPGHKISALDFRAACREYAWSQIDIQRKEFMRLGVIGDWQHPYATMDFAQEAGIIRALGKMIAKGHVQKGSKPVQWCLDCASSLAEAEVEYAEKTSPALDVQFAVIDVADFWQRFAEKPSNQNLSLSIPIWTTTPWTLPANQAVALNAGLDYVVVEFDSKGLLLAEGLVASVMARYQIENYRIIARILGEKLLGVKLKHPFDEKTVPLILGEHVTVESGTGAVHTAPAHGVDDYEMGKRYQLPLTNPIGDDGCFNKNIPHFAGQHVNKVNEKIIELLKTHGTLLHAATVRHSYPHCWRHKTPLIYRATSQWFVSMEQQGLRDQALKAIDHVEWIPDWGKSRIIGMIANRPDWCISRQRTWGVPLGLFVHKETGDYHPNTVALLEKVAERVEQQGIEAWFALESEELLGADAAQYRKSQDVLDVWFDSGVMPECILKPRSDLHYPADLVLEGSDQHRGWFQSQLLTGVGINDQPPYLAVLTHGFTVDANGHKMSKSIGNVIAPDEVIATSGADILRLWIGSLDYRTDITATKEIFTTTTETYRRIRNTARFLLANLHDFNPDEHLVSPDDMIMLDRWIMDKAAAIQRDILVAYETYQFHLVIQKLHHFCITDLGGFYLDVIKDRQYTMPTQSLGRRSAQTALFHIAHAFVRWMAPILSFTAEEIWQYLPGKHEASVLLTTWYEAIPTLPKDESMNETYWEKIRAVRDAVNKEIEKERNANKIGSALEAEVSLYCAPNLQQQLETLGDELRFVLITSVAKVIPDHASPLDSVITEVPGLRLKITATTAAKCDRCWHRVSDVNTIAAYPGLCKRCVENISGAGEHREYA